MARGWESKSVEEQQAEKANAKPLQEKLAPEEQVRLREVHAIKLQIARLDTQISKATNERYRSQLTAARADLEAKLRELNKG